MSEEYKEILNCLISMPLRSQIQVDFDVKKKFFELSMPIFSTRDPLPDCIKGYVEARKNHIFKPHATSFREEGNRVLLFQEIPFNWGFQPGMREHIKCFWDMGKRLHRMLSEISIEEKQAQALQLDS